MLQRLKQIFFFPIAYYFRFFAGIQLRLWHPRVIVVTGSSGKTTLLHLIESQLKGKARYSHHANSAYGIPFDILGLKRNNLEAFEWLYLFFAAPIKAFKTPYRENIYIAEADCDRPGEGSFLASLLHPEITLWVSSSRTHSLNFDQLVREKKFASVEKAIAYEFGHFLEHTTARAIIDGDSTLIVSQLDRTKKITVTQIKKTEQLQIYAIKKNTTEFIIDKQRYAFDALLPQEAFYSVAMTVELMKYLNMPLDMKFTGFSLPPGRSSVFKGIKNTTLIDSTYNATLDSMRAILHMFYVYPEKKKWVVLGDMIEQGKEEQEEHEKLATSIADLTLEKIILVGPRVAKYAYPKLKVLIKDSDQITVFTEPKDALDYLVKNIKGEETILFKGARFLEGVIEHLLSDPKDKQKLCRREKIWESRRKKWKL